MYLISEHRLVLGDYGSEEPVGIITVNYHENDDDYHHWVTFPNGTVRKYYEFKKIDDNTYDLLMAFGTIPELKVSYRIWSKILENYGVPFILSQLGIIATCLIMVLLDKANLLSITDKIEFFIIITCIVSLSIVCITVVMDIIITKRYYNYTKHDIKPMKWHKENGW